MPSEGLRSTLPGSPDTALLVTRVAYLEDTLRDILDFTSGWSRAMTIHEAMELIQKTATEALND